MFDTKCFAKPFICIRPLNPHTNIIYINIKRNCSIMFHSGPKRSQLERAGAEICTQALSLFCTCFLSVPGGAVQGSRGLCFYLMTSAVSSNPRGLYHWSGCWGGLPLRVSTGCWPFLVCSFVWQQCGSRLVLHCIVCIEIPSLLLVRICFIAVYMSLLGCSVGSPHHHGFFSRQQAVGICEQSVLWVWGRMPNQLDLECQINVMFGSLQ